MFFLQLWIVDHKSVIPIKEAVLKAAVHKESIHSEQLLQDVSFLAMDISISWNFIHTCCDCGETMNLFNSKQMSSHKMNTLHAAMGYYIAAMLKLILELFSQDDSSECT